MINIKFNMKDRINSFRYSFNGIFNLFQTEVNAWIHFMSTLVVISLGFYLKINKIDWCLIIFAIGFVLVTETINTSIEKLTDLVSPEFHPLAKRVKDLAAGAVLIAVFIAICVGFIVFGNYFLNFFSPQTH